MWHLSFSGGSLPSIFFLVLVEGAAAASPGSRPRPKAESVAVSDRGLAAEAGIEYIRVCILPGTLSVGDTDTCESLGYQSSSVQAEPSPRDQAKEYPREADPTATAWAWRATEPIDLALARGEAEHRQALVEVGGVPAGQRRGQSFGGSGSWPRVSVSLASAAGTSSALQKDAPDGSKLGSGAAPEAFEAPDHLQMSWQQGTYVFVNKTTRVTDSREGWVGDALLDPYPGDADSFGNPFVYLAGISPSAETAVDGEEAAQSAAVAQREVKFRALLWLRFDASLTAAAGTYELDSGVKLSVTWGPLVGTPQRESGTAVEVGRGENPIEYSIPLKYRIWNFTNDQRSQGFASIHGADAGGAATPVVATDLHSFGRIFTFSAKPVDDLTQEKPAASTPLLTNATKYKYYDSLTSVGLPPDDMYLGKPRPLDEYRYLVERTGQKYINLMCASCVISADEMCGNAWDDKEVFGKLDSLLFPIVQQLHDSGLLQKAEAMGKQFYVYGFDESPRSCEPAIRRFYGFVRTVYGSVVQTVAVLNWAKSSLEAGVEVPETTSSAGSSETSPARESGATPAARESLLGAGPAPRGDSPAQIPDIPLDLPVDILVTNYYNFAPSQANPFFEEWVASSPIVGAEAGPEWGSSSPDYGVIEARLAAATGSSAPLGPSRDSSAGNIGAALGKRGGSSGPRSSGSRRAVFLYHCIEPSGQGYLNTFTDRSLIESRLLYWYGAAAFPSVSGWLYYEVAKFTTGCPANPVEHSPLRRMAVGADGSGSEESNYTGVVVGGKAELRGGGGSVVSGSRRTSIRNGSATGVDARAASQYTNFNAGDCIWWPQYSFWGNGDGQFVYPGEVGEAPVQGARLANFLDAWEDVAMFRMVASAGASAGGDAREPQESTPSGLSRIYPGWFDRCKAGEKVSVTVAGYKTHDFELPSAPPSYSLRRPCSEIAAELHGWVDFMCRADVQHRDGHSYWTFVCQNCRTSTFDSPRGPQQQHEEDGSRPGLRSGFHLQQEAGLSSRTGERRRQLEDWVWAQVKTVVWGARDYNRTASAHKLLEDIRRSIGEKVEALSTQKHGPIDVHDAEASVVGAEALWGDSISARVDASEGDHEIPTGEVIFY